MIVKQAKHNTDSTSSSRLQDEGRTACPTTTQILVCSGSRGPVVRDPEGLAVIVEDALGDADGRERLPGRRPCHTDRREEPRARPGVASTQSSIVVDRPPDIFLRVLDADRREIGQCWRGRGP